MKMAACVHKLCLKLGITNILVILVLHCAEVAMGQTPQPPPVTIQDNDCEVPGANGEIKYQACLSEPLHLLRPENAKFTLEVEPANYTCGSPKKSFCTLGLLNCSECDAASPALSHPVEYMTDFIAATRLPNKQTSWQSIGWDGLYPTPLQINITISFDKSYEMQSDLILTFESSRPKNMIIEKSTDYGQNWTVLQYYQDKCKDLFQAGVRSTVPMNQPDAVICTQKYSTLQPYRGGEVEFAVIKDRLGLFLGTSLTNYENLYNAYSSTNLNEFLTFTDIRIQLNYPATNGLESTRVKEELWKFYYAISDIKLVGSCSCNLHAKSCVIQGNKTVCDCQHNTMGDSCESCLPLFNNKPWKAGQYLPYPSGTANQCEKCTCNDHATSCTYSDIYKRGVCDNCFHNTTGINCELCAEGFYRNVSVPLNDTEVCLDCNCEMLGVSNNNTKCEASGQCFCKALVTGRRCDLCVDQYYGLLANNGVCNPCLCNQFGTIAGSNVCEKQAGQCPCKKNVGLRDCSACKDGYFNFPSVGSIQADCLDCECDAGGSITMTCDKVTGICACRPNFIGRHCNQTTPGFYTPHLDVNKYQPKAEGSTCQLSTAMHTTAYPFSGRVFINCQQSQVAQFDPITGLQTQPLVRWVTRPVIRYTLNGTEQWNAASLSISVTGNSNIALQTYQGRTNETLSSTCPHAAGVSFALNYANFTAGTGKSLTAGENVSIDARCTYSISLTMGDAGNASQPIMIDSVVFITDKEDVLAYTSLDGPKKPMYDNCQKRILDLNTRQQALQDYYCKKYSFATGAGMARAALPCNCDPVGAVGGQCESLGGQCTCKPGVFGRSCDRCAPGFYNLTATGCTQCPYLPCPGDRDFLAAVGEDNSSMRTVLIVVIVILIILIIIVIFLICRYRKRFFRKNKEDRISFIDVGQKDPTSPVHSKDVYANYVDQAMDDEINDMNYSGNSTPIPFGEKIEEDYLIGKNRRKKNKNLENESLRESIKTSNKYNSMGEPKRKQHTYVNQAYEVEADLHEIPEYPYKSETRHKAKPYNSESSYADPNEIVIPVTIEKPPENMAPRTDQDRYGSIDRTNRGRDRTSMTDNLLEPETYDVPPPVPEVSGKITDSVARRKKRNLPRVLPGPDGRWTDSPLIPANQNHSDNNQQPAQPPSNNVPKRSSSKRSLPDLPPASGIDSGKVGRRPSQNRKLPDPSLVTGRPGQAVPVSRTSSTASRMSSSGKTLPTIPGTTAPGTDQHHTPQIRMPKAAMKRMPEQDEIVISPQNIEATRAAPLAATVSRKPSQNRTLPNPMEIQRRMSSASSRGAAPVEQRGTGAPVSSKPPVHPASRSSSKASSSNAPVSRRPNKNRKLPELGGAALPETGVKRTPSQIQKLAEGDVRKRDRKMTRDEAKVKFQSFAEQINEEISGSLV